MKMTKLLSTLVVVGGIALIAAVVVLPKFIKRPSCPNHTYPVVTAHDSFDVVPLAGAITDIPEFHDCQRLLTESSKPGQASFGPLVGLWVAEGLAERWQQLIGIAPAKIEPGTRDTVAGSSGNKPGITPPSVVIGGMAIAFVQLYAWDGGYTPLGIGQWWNCLYLYLRPDSLHLAAKMVHTRDTEACKKVSVPSELVGDSVTDLYATRTVLPGLKPEDYPLTGRWDWDMRNTRQYIGFTCGAGWCEVTANEDYAQSPTYARTPSTGPGDRVLGVKGWYDEQTVAVPPPGVFQSLFPWLYALVPASFTGTIVPDPGLDGKDLAYFDHWVPAGFVVMSGSHNKYSASYNYGPGTMPTTPGNAENVARLSLCHGTACRAPKSCTWKDPTQAGWYAKIDYHGSTKYACVKRVDHSGEDRKIPGTARWFWDAKDEKGWVSCAVGCCTIQ